MKFRYIVASLAVHAAIIATMAGICHYLPLPSPSPEQPVPVFFEIVEELLPSAESEERQEEKTEPVPMEKQESVPMEEPKSVPTQPMGTDPEENTETTAGIGMAASMMPPVAAVSSKPPYQMPPRKCDFATASKENVKKDSAETKESSPAETNCKTEQAKVVSNPVALNRIIPVYPRSARRRGHEGCVTVEIMVAEDGRVSGAEVVSPSGHAELDAAAIGAVRTARFAPATEDGVSVRGRLRLTFEFKLE